MSRRTIRWQKQHLSGPAFMTVWPEIIPQALDGAVPMSAAVMTLGIYADADTPLDWHSIEQVTEQHPARILIIQRRESSASFDGLDVELRAEVEQPDDSGRPPLLFSECLAMTLSGKTAAYWIDWVQALIRSNIPAYLWWAGSPPDDDFRWDLLSQSFQALILDSRKLSLGEWHQLAESASHAHMSIMDLDWARGLPPRRLLAEACDDPTVLSVLSQPHHISVASPSTDHLMLPSTWLWLSWRLGWDLGLPPCGRPGLAVEATFGATPSWTFDGPDGSLRLTASDSWVLGWSPSVGGGLSWSHTLPENPGLSRDLTDLLEIGLDPLYEQLLRQAVLGRSQ
jgi:hypothetical protein